MMYIDFSAGNKEYKLRLNIRAIASLEKAIGCNPLSIFGNGSTIPTVTTMVNVLHASLQQYHHGVTLNDAFDIFEKYIEDGHMPTDFIETIVEIYKASGLMKQDSDEDTEKN